MWESATGYARFREYYLPLEAPRSLLAAYRNYIRRQRGSEAAAEISKVAGSWNQWFYATDRNGRPLEGAIGWEARAEAWDNQQRDRQLRKLERERREYDDQIAGLRKTVMDRLTQMLSWPLQQVTVDNGKMIVEPVRWDLNTVARLLREFDRVFRLSTGGPTEQAQVSVDMRHGGVVTVASQMSDEELDDEITRLLRQHAAIGQRGAVADAGTAGEPAAGDAADADSGGEE